MFLFRIQMNRNMFYGFFRKFQLKLISLFYRTGAIFTNIGGDTLSFISDGSATTYMCFQMARYRHLYFP